MGIDLICFLFVCPTHAPEGCLRMGRNPLKCSGTYMYRRVRTIQRRMCAGIGTPGGINMQCTRVRCALCAVRCCVCGLTWVCMGLAWAGNISLV
jgi:hypothetical protein